MCPIRTIVKEKLLTLTDSLVTDDSNRPQVPMRYIIAAVTKIFFTSHYSLC